MAKYLTRSSLFREAEGRRSYFALQVKGLKSVAVGKARQQEAKASGHIASTVVSLVTFLPL